MGLFLHLLAHIPAQACGCIPRLPHGTDHFATNPIRFSSGSPILPDVKLQLA